MSLHENKQTAESDTPDVRCRACGVACCHGHPLRWLARVIAPASSKEADR